VRSEADLGLVFVAADGPLDGCGEASMFAAMLVLGSRPEVRLETGAGLIIARSSGEARITLTMPPGTSRVDVAEVSYEGKRLQVRTVTAGGNIFAAVHHGFGRVLGGARRDGVRGDTACPAPAPRTQGAPPAEVGQAPVRGAAVTSSSRL
ncbi:hypothetical protein ABZ815_52210, partial [Nonomuraea sp. NPDC047529]|uniref:hypothetical protein n=1 Tax=Nonomuraea sp. NPDC047529 TaxID=3155623 RepID=UPI0033C7B5CF